MFADSAETGTRTAGKCTACQMLQRLQRTQFALLGGCGPRARLLYAKSREHHVYR